MILGIGTDLIEVARIRASFERFGGRFLSRILRPAEIAYCLTHKDPAQRIAARFAAKEAISKAFGTGIGAELGWHDMEVLRKPSGEPYVELNGNGLDLFKARAASHLHISLSHTSQHAVAMAVLESSSPSTL